MLRMLRSGPGTLLPCRSPRLTRPLLVWGLFCQGGAARGFSIFLIPQLFCSTSAELSLLSNSNFSSSTAPQAFPRPDRQVLTPARVGAVKAGPPIGRPPTGLALRAPSTTAHLL